MNKPTPIYMPSYIRKIRRQGQRAPGRVHIRPLIEGWQKEALMKDADKRRITMNAIIRELLTERYGKKT